MPVRWCGKFQLRRFGVDSCDPFSPPKRAGDGKGGAMTLRTLPRNPNLKFFNDQAKNLLRDFRQGNALTLARQSLVDSLFDTSDIRLADAQYMVAREYGYAGWLNLKQNVDALARVVKLQNNSWVYKPS
jgi:hypothetical protein